MASFPRILIASFEKTLRFFSSDEAIHRAGGVVFRMLLPNVFVMIPQTLHELIIETPEVIPNFALAMYNSNLFAVSFKIAGT